MEKLENPQIGYRYRLLRELLLLTVKEVNFLTKIPITNLRRIEDGEISSEEELDELSDLYQIEKEIILDPEFLLPTWKDLRRKGILKHRNNEHYIKAINKKPRPKRAVEFRLLKSDYMTDYKTVANATRKMKLLYRWIYDESRIDYAFNTLVDEGVLEKLKQKGQPFKYRKSRSIPKYNWQILDRIITELEEIVPSKNIDSLTPAHYRMAGMLYVLRKGPKKGQDLFKLILYSYSPKNIEKSLKILIDIGMIEMTEEDVNSSKQMYRLTGKGRELLRKLGVNN
ncbi:hypothetical protein SAMN05216436_10349 [bacterium A37T11]|nr:hypothetical protein SAMN05216436_10349 [bacterium A37T11]